MSTFQTSRTLNPQQSTRIPPPLPFVLWPSAVRRDLVKLSIRWRRRRPRPPRRRSSSGCYGGRERGGGLSSMLGAEIKSVCKNCYNAPNACFPYRLPLNHSESIGGGGAGGQGRMMLRKKCCDFDWFVFAKNGDPPTFAISVVDCLLFWRSGRATRRRNGWLTLSLSGRGCGGGSSWFGGRSVCKL